MARDREAWKMILKEDRVLRGLEEKKQSFNEQQDRAQYFIFGEHVQLRVTYSSSVILLSHKDNYVYLVHFFHLTVLHVSVAQIRHHRPGGGGCTRRVKERSNIIILFHK